MEIPLLNPDNVQAWGDKPTHRIILAVTCKGFRSFGLFQDLGINAIYFTPFFQANTNHKYDTSDYLQIDKQFGSNQTLKSLVIECHKRGIRVIPRCCF